MAIVIESTTLSEIGDSDTEFTINMPSTRPDDDLYVCILVKDDDPAVTIPSPAADHWNQFVSIEENSAIRMQGWWWLGSSEPASYTVSQDSETDTAVVYRLSGADTTNPINAFGSSQASSGVNQSAPAITPTVSNTLVLRVMTVDGVEVTEAPATEDYSGIPAGGSGRVGYGYSHEAGPAADVSTGTAQFTHSSGEWISFTVAIAPGELDETSPILTSPRAYSVSSSAANLEIVTDEDNGTLYWTVGTASLMTPTNVKSAQKNPADSGNQNVSTVGTQSLGRATGLSQNMLYWFAAMHEDSSTNQSLVVSSSFTTLRNVLIFNSWNTVLETTLLYMNGVFTQNINTVNTSILQGTSPDLPSTTLIDSIQYVDIQMGTGTTGTATFNAVDRSRSIILTHGNWIGSHIQSDGNSDPETVLCRKEFSADNEITITRGTGDVDNTFTVRVQVIEFAEGVIEAIHTGSHTITGTNTTSTSENIDTDSDSTNWIILNNGHEFGDPTSSGRLGFAIVRWSLTESAGNISIQATRGDNSETHDTICQYTAFRFVDGIIDSKQVVSITNNSGTTGSASITSVDRNRSAIWQSGHTVATAGAGYDQFQHFQKFRFASNTSVQSTIFSSPAEPATINLQVIEFADGYINSIQSGSTTINTSQTFASQSISNVDITKTILFIDGATSDEGGATPHDPEYSYFAGKLQPNGEAIVFNRGTSAPGSESLIVGWRLVEFN